MNNERALPISVQAARAFAAVGKGLVLTLLREQQVVGVLHLDTDATSAVGTAAAAMQADQALLIVVGSLKFSGRLMLQADEVRKLLVANGIAVNAVVHVTALDEGQRWTDLSPMNPRDGIIGRFAGRRR